MGSFCGNNYISFLTSHTFLTFSSGFLYIAPKLCYNFVTKEAEMKFHRITKKTKLTAFALSVYFALIFTNTPNVISEEYPSVIIKPTAQIRLQRSVQVYDEGEMIENVLAGQKTDIPAEEKNSEPVTVKPSDKKPEAVTKDELSPAPQQKPDENIPDTTPEQAPEQTPEPTPGQTPGQAPEPTPEPPQDEPQEDNYDTPAGDPMTVIATAYCGCYDCNGKWAGYPAADGSPLKAYHTIAADESIPFGTKVYIPYFGGYHNGGIFEVQDRGSAIVGNRIDIYFDSHSKALEFGMREMTIYVL